MLYVQLGIRQWWLKYETGKFNALLWKNLLPGGTNAKWVVCILAATLQSCLLPLCKPMNV